MGSLTSPPVEYSSFISKWCHSAPASCSTERLWATGSPESVHSPPWSWSAAADAIDATQLSNKLVSSPFEQEDAVLRVSALSAAPRFSPATETVDRVTLEGLVKSREGVSFLLGLRGEEAASCIEVLDEVIGSTEKSSLKCRCLEVLRKLCGVTGLLPYSFHLSSRSLKRKGRRPEAAGGYADIWRGDYDGREVAVKVFRGYDSSGVPPLDMKALLKEAVVWKHLRHPNIVPFVGIDTEMYPLSLVCEWMPHGTITAYILSDPTADRLKLLKDIAEGLQYLHDMNVVHGDLKGANVLINDKHVACLADFGLATLSHHGKLTTLSVTAWSPRWTAPEVFDPEQFGLTRATLSSQSDIYSWSMVAWEVFSGLLPFHDCGHPGAIPWRVLSGMRPPRPAEALTVGLTDDVWELMQRCWQPDPRVRPRISDVLTCLADAIQHATLARLEGYLTSPLSIVFAESDLHDLFGTNFV
ncbi:hypothetical protein CERSUDRAFT_65942 [Gelatoporia subvermispora B]|uniref:Protein kinase domain-containing protein n=1 Tax=Ceriporiopsis subvermispora (strain B) TaxID=914234 RepID=M2RBQ2_CERS8|nr:hypothetical protein CERSUDRAFT_65942 [Gelatoporia subvermispora B]